MNELEATDWIALIAAGITLLGVIFTFVGVIFTYKGVRQTVKVTKENSNETNQIQIKLGEMSADTQGKQRLIETVSLQRVEWINRVRDYFSQYSKITYQMAQKRAEGNEFGDLQYELVYLVNHIELFLNPSETVTKKFIELKDSISKYLLNDVDKFSWSEYGTLMLDLHYIEQVILKAEWKRLKEETKTGLEVDNMEVIHKTIAQKIDSVMYNRLLKDAF